MANDIELSLLGAKHEDGEDEFFDGSKRAEYEPSQNGESDSDEEDLVVDDGSRALLRGHTTSETKENVQNDRLWPQIRGIVIEGASTLLFTTVGLLFTGELLDHVSHWHAMLEVDQLIMIIPVVLNLKGNLEMNLSARLGTAANVGELDEPQARREIIVGNLALLQVQAAVVSFIAAGVSLVLGIIIPPAGAEVSVQTRNQSTRTSGLPTFVMVACCAMGAASLSSMILGSFMCSLVVGCRYLGLDPDNIAPPIASCLGDLVTLLLLGAVATTLIYVMHTPIPFVVAIIITLFAISCGFYVRRNSHVAPLLTQGWSPLFGAMIISSGTGIVLDMFVTRYEGFALLAVVISGLPGAVGSIFASRLSTSLHAAAYSLAPPATAAPGPARREPSTKVVMLVLLLVTIPVEMIFLGILAGLNWLRPPVMFVAFSIVFFCTAVASSLLIARWLVNFLWARKLDPDMYALPVHSALMDLIGQLLLVLCYEIVSLFGIKLNSAR
ncbi:unnamed protein product [Mycena citricolor]|uniref:SLC41A/MgtE integral membrane domain-containing protein n=1 Tax=Mycena citricolor TaxID=2018698 RepID=A0AAD2HQI6_9AGAR|nr:unnamed protein product [Mycena citricolor]